MYSLRHNGKGWKTCCLLYARKTNKQFVHKKEQVLVGQLALTINFKWVRSLPKGKAIVHYRVQARSEAFIVGILDLVCRYLYDTRWKQIIGFPNLFAAIQWSYEFLQPRPCNSTVSKDRYSDLIQDQKPKCRQIYKH